MFKISNTPPTSPKNITLENGRLHTKISDKRIYVGFLIVDFPFPDDDYPEALPNGMYISQLVHFAHIYNKMSDFNECVLSRSKCYNILVIVQWVGINILHVSY